MCLIIELWKLGNIILKLYICINQYRNITLKWANDNA